LLYNLTLAVVVIAQIVCGALGSLTIFPCLFAAADAIFDRSGALARVSPLWSVCVRTNQRKGCCEGWSWNMCRLSWYRMLACNWWFQWSSTEAWSTSASGGRTIPQNVQDLPKLCRWRFCQAHTGKRNCCLRKTPVWPRTTRFDDTRHQRPPKHIHNGKEASPEIYIVSEKEGGDRALKAIRLETW